MARSDLLIKLVHGACRGDETLFRRTLEAIIADERRKQHHVLADRLLEYLKPNGFQAFRAPPSSDPRLPNLLLEFTPRKKLSDLLLPAVTATACAEFVEEHHRRDLLRSYNLEPRNRVLLAGPPGNGKTSLAEALAEALMVPMYLIRYEGVIGSYLGETAVRLRHIFDYVRTRHCVLFLDEFDTLGKERGDLHETGEIKRVVSSLLLQVDDLPSHVVIIAATNHPELLDRAVWRRFQLQLHLPPPSRALIQEWFKRLQGRIGQPLCYSPAKLAEALEGLSFAEIEEFAADILRRYVLALPNADLKQIVDGRLEQWQNRFKIKKSE